MSKISRYWQNLYDEIKFNKFSYGDSLDLSCMIYYFLKISKIFINNINLKKKKTGFLLNDDFVKALQSNTTLKHIDLACK